MFLNGLTFSTYSRIWCSEGGYQVSFWCLLVALGSLFLILEGTVIEIVIVIVGAIVIGLPWTTPG